MKIIVANWVYDWGSTGYILRDLRNELVKQGYDAIATCGIIKGTEDENVFVFGTTMEIKLYHRLGRLGRAKFAGSPRATKHFISFIENEKPDIVHLHLLHCATIDLYELLEWLGKNNIKTVLTHHAELYYTGGCGYAHDCNKWFDNQCVGCEIPNIACGSYYFANPHRNWMKIQEALSFFKPNNLYHTTVSPWVKTRFQRSPFSIGYSCDVVMNGINTDIYYFRQRDEAIFTNLPSNSNQYVVHVSANFDPTNKEDIKGGYYVAEIAKMMPEVMFVVVATTNSKCENLPSNIYMWGKAKDQGELASLYSNATVTLLTSKRETFSMICSETLCCGTPVVGFFAGGPETISIPKYSYFVEYANLEKLKKALSETFQNSFNRQIMSDEARTIYSRKAMTDGYIAVYKKILKK